jgi:PAS domain S-box-containing protein
MGAAGAHVVLTIESKGVRMQSSTSQQVDNQGSRPGGPLQPATLWMRIAPDGLIVDGSDPLFTMLGRDRDSVAGMQVTGLAHPDDLPRPFPWPNLLDLRLLTADQTWLPMTARAEWSPARGNGQAGLLVHLVERNDSSLAGRAVGRVSGLSDLRDLLDPILELAHATIRPVAIDVWLVGPRGCLRRVAGRGDGALAVLGDGWPIERAGFPAAEAAASRAIVAVPDAPRAAEYPGLRRALTEGQERSSLSVPLFGRSGDVCGVLDVWWASRTVPEDHAGPLDCCARATATSIEGWQTRTTCARRMADLDAHIDNMPLAAIEMDSNLVAQRWSASAVRLLGWSVGDVVGVPLASQPFLHPDASAELLTMVAGLTRGRTTRGLLSTRVRRVDGRVLATEWHCSAIRDASGTCSGVLVQMHDLGPRRTVDAATRTFRQLDAVSSLSAALANDFNNLLTTISGRLELLDETVTGPAGKAHLERANAALNSAAGLTRQLLEWSGEIRGTGRVDLCGIVSSVADQFNNNHSSRLELALTLPSRPITVLGDDNRLGRVTYNLVNQVVERTSDEHRVLRVVLDAVELSDAEAALVCTGQPLPAGSYAVLRVEAMRGAAPSNPESNNSRRAEPTSLSSTALQGVLRAMGGAMDHQARRGHIVAHAYLPIADTSIVTNEPIGAQPQGRAVLVVDDDEGVRRVVRMALEDAGHTVIEARDGLEGLQVWRAHRTSIGLLLVDLNMPGMDGLRALSEVRRIDPSLPVLLSSGMGIDAVASTLALDDRADFIQKPFSLRHLVSVVSRYV